VGNAFDRPLVLLHDVVEIFGVSDGEGRLVSALVVLNRGSIAATLINGNLCGQPLVANRFAQEGLGGVPIASGRQQKVNRATLFVHGTVQLSHFPLIFT